MVVVSGEKAVYRCVAAPSMKVDHGDGGRGSGGAAETYERALGAAYSYVVSASVDRLLDLVEYTFLREAGCAPTSQDGGTAPELDIRAAASAAAAGLRIVDGVRMLGPSLTKLCELDSSKGKGGPSPSDGGGPAAPALCISLHRSTVKNCAKTLENLARSIQLDRGAETADGRVAAVSSDVVHAVRVVSPFHSAYKSVSKRRALPWDSGIGDDAGEMDVFVRFLVKQLLISLQGKAQNYRAEGDGPGGQDALAKSHLFLMNNTYYLLDLLAADSFGQDDQDVRLGEGAVPQVLGPSQLSPDRRRRRAAELPEQQGRAVAGVGTAPQVAVQRLHRGLRAGLHRPPELHRHRPEAAGYAPGRHPRRVPYEVRGILPEVLEDQFLEEEHGELPKVPAAEDRLAPRPAVPDAVRCTTGGGGDEGVVVAVV
ncbi:hypothetical protein THAOC_09905 [Thalassiosira oceanica]|uniref:Exocyst complex subunit Exo70 C-terminal domain-containing protein n=1 Tax=Thalassiosira oceanica TaxID=159749 RepID=K0SV97_THAOC|nr:hypothetical protein THAOC_09905 [Thalassiosira oceanica]|eukprot:EJK68884.1 hypothetical protein THAOC_09905 [Thalassiosira oceanica]